MLLESIDHRRIGSANEWCVLDYDVAGLFIEWPIQYLENGSLKDMKLREVFENFPGQAVYGFNECVLSEAHPSGKWGAPVTVDRFYPVPPRARN